MMHTDISRAYFHAPCREEKYVELPPEMWSEEYPEYGRLVIGGTLGGCVYQSTAGTSVRMWGCVSMFVLLTKERIRIIVRGDNFMSGGPRSKLE